MSNREINQKLRIWLKDGVWRCSDNCWPSFCGAGITPALAYRDYLYWNRFAPKWGIRILQGNVDHGKA